MVLWWLSLSLFYVTSICLLGSPVVVGLTKPSGVKLENNEYRGIVVAIHADEPENGEIIANIKDMFISGSTYLYNATKKRAFFKEVTILIPLTWSDSPNYTSPGNATFKGADIIVAAYNPRFAPHGDNSALPYTKQFAGCGKQSLYIHMTSSFLSNVDHLQSVVGNYGRVLVHEWGHYRWGLFNEYPDTRTDQNKAKYFYFSDINQIWEPVSCTDGWRLVPLKYTGRSPPYRRCRGNERIGYEYGCFSVPSGRQSPHVTGSIMHSYLMFDQIINFCDSDPDDPSYLHNSEAPTKQNERCDGKSSWEVMREHPDFNGTTNNPPREVDDVTPTFFVVRAKIMRVVLVLDTSGSMSTSDRYLRLAEAARTYIMTLAATGTFIGIVDFDSCETVLSDLQELTSDSKRRTLANLVPEDASGGTCIGCGMDGALRILTAYGDPGGSKILLMTDGIDGDATRTTQMKNEYIRLKIIIDSIAIGNAAEPALVDLAESTGGRLYLQTDSITSTGIRGALADNSGGERIELQSAVVNFEVADGDYHRSVYIDNTVGNLTIFDFSYFADNPSTGAAIHVTITSPSGVTFDQSSSIYEADLTFRKVLIKIPDTAESGSWEYHIQNQVTTLTHDVIVSVSSSPSQEGVDPIVVSSFLSGSPNDIINNKPFVAYAEVRQRFYPVIWATVIATIETPSGVSVDLLLYDNGAGADVTKNDGIYSRYFTQITGAGYYGFKIHVENNGEAIILRPESSTRFSGVGIYFDPEELLDGNITEFETISMSLPGAPIPDIVGVLAPNFTRGVSGGASSLTEIPPGWDPSMDTLAPNKITDLSVVNTSFSLGIVTVTFTAPGDDFDFGSAQSYSIQWSNSSRELREKLSTNNNINQSDILHGNLSCPPPYGNDEMIIFRLMPPSHLETYSVSLGLYAVDESGNEADMSNIVKVTFRMTVPSPEPPQSITSTDVGGSTPPRTTSKMTAMPPTSKTPYVDESTTSKMTAMPPPTSKTPYVKEKSENEKMVHLVILTSSSSGIVLIVCAFVLLLCYLHTNNKRKRGERLKVTPYGIDNLVLVDA